MNHQADFMRLECALGLSQKTSDQLLHWTRKTRRDVEKILWECRFQMKLIDNFSGTETFYWIDPDQKIFLRERYMQTENTFYELSKQ